MCVFNLKLISTDNSIVPRYTNVREIDRLNLNENVRLPSSAEYGTTLVFKKRLQIVLATES